jgi:oligogalacturonide transporter
MQAAAVMCVGLILQAGGFVSDNKTTQSPEAVTTIVLVLAVGTLTLLAIGFIISLRFHLDRDTHAVLMAEIDRFKSHPETRPSPEDRKIVEDLTGWPYEKLWGSANTLTDRAVAPPLVGRDSATLGR